MDAVLGWDGLMDTGIDCNNRGMFIIFNAQKAFKMLQMIIYFQVDTNSITIY